MAVEKPDRSYFEAQEIERLAPYAAYSRASRGRAHPEPEHAYRTAYQRDRDRVVHSTAFRRLEYKTQVFVNHEGDHYRTRLTHSLEAAQIARALARRLLLNEDLAETVTLAHDLGHTPFGHAGQDEMNGLMKEHGGFEHNLQALRIVDYLEKRYPGFRGLNLTHEVREGIFKHSPGAHADGPFADASQPTLEAQLVDLADEIAYTNHDLEDGLTSKILQLEPLNELALWREHFGQCCEAHPNETPKLLVKMTVRAIIGTLITDLVEEIRRRLDAHDIRTAADVKSQPDRLSSFTTTTEAKKTQLKQYLFVNLYRDYRVVRMAEKAKRVIRELFLGYTSNPLQLPPHIRARVDDDGLHRVACDYIAGMTDRFAADEHRKLFDPRERL